MLNAKEILDFVGEDFDRINEHAIRIFKRDYEYKLVEKNRTEFYLKQEDKKAEDYKYAVGMLIGNKYPVNEYIEFPNCIDTIENIITGETEPFKSIYHGHMWSSTLWLLNIENNLKNVDHDEIIDNGLESDIDIFFENLKRKDIRSFNTPSEAIKNYISKKVITNFKSVDSLLELLSLLGKDYIQLQSEMISNIDTLRLLTTPINGKYYSIKEEDIQGYEILTVNALFTELSSRNIITMKENDAIIFENYDEIEEYIRKSSDTRVDILLTNFNKDLSHRFIVYSKKHNLYISALTHGSDYIRFAEKLKEAYTLDRFGRKRMNYDMIHLKKHTYI